MRRTWIVAVLVTGLTCGCTLTPDQQARRDRADMLARKAAAYSHPLVIEETPDARVGLP